MLKTLIRKFYKQEVFDEIVKIKILNGIFYIKIHRLTLEKNIRIFGFSIYRKKLSDTLKYQALSRYLKSKNINKKFVYNFAGSPSGELYILLNLFDEIINDKNPADIIFLVDKTFKKNLCELYKPNIECLILDPILLGFYAEDKFKDENYEIFSLFTTKHYLDQDILINNNNEHYYEYILKDLKLKGISDFKTPNISKRVKEKIQKYIHSNNLDNFIIISPEANTSKELGKSFWNGIVSKLKENEYKVYLNITNFKNAIEGCYTDVFNHEEIIELAKYSKGIIGLRSGLIEILSTIDIPKIVIYQGFDKRGQLKSMSSEKALTGFTLNKLPNSKNNELYEFAMSNDLNKKVLEKITNLYIKKGG